MKNLVLPNYLESQSVEARQEMDLRIGCAFTRFQTQFFHVSLPLFTQSLPIFYTIHITTTFLFVSLQGKYGDLDSALISYGPCQTPTLGFCVDRHDKILSFQPEPYWVLVVNVGSPSKGLNFTLDWDRGREFNNNIAKSYFNKVKSQRTAVVTGVSKKEKSKSRPGALNTVEMLRVASSGLSIGPHQAMQIAERLYTQGYISYPRTETSQYPKNFDLGGVLRLFSSNQEYSKEVSKLLSKGWVKPKGGHDSGDHPPITPMKSATSNDLHDRDSWRLYDYIARHFIGTLSGDCKYEQTTINFAIGDEKFSKTGAEIIDPGFTDIMPWLAISEDMRITSSISVGDEFVVGEVRLDERHTTPPDYLSEADLISLMEKHGIGTDASIPTHINNICVRNYVKISGGRRLIPTKLGIVLVHGYQRIDSDLVLPTRRAAMEVKLNEIAAGTADFHQVLTSAIEEFVRKFDNYTKNINLMDELFEVSFSSLADSGKPLSRCGKCRRYLKLISAKPVRLYCPNCHETLTVPHNGALRIHKELKCPVDDYELLYFTAFGPNSKSYVLCPHCFNNPPFEDMRKLSGCNLCPNSECSESMENNKISNCTSCTYGGSIVLDATSGLGGAKWKMFCNKCDAFISGLKDASKFKIQLNKTCESCSSKLVHLEFNKKDTEPSSLDGCIFCTTEISKELYFHTQKKKTGYAGNSSSFHKTDFQSSNNHNSNAPHGGDLEKSFGQMDLNGRG